MLNLEILNNLYSVPKQCRCNGGKITLWYNMKGVELYLYLQHFCNKTGKIHAALRLEEEVSSKERVSPSIQKSNGDRHVVNAD